MAPEEVMAQGVGFVSTIFIIFSFQCKTNRGMFLCQMIGVIIGALHFFMLGNLSPAMMNLIGLARSIVLAIGERAHKKWILALLTVAFVVGAVFTWEGLISLLPLFGQLIGLFAMWTFNGKTIRVAQCLIVSPLWLTNNILCFSISGMFCESFNIVSSIVALLRFGPDGFEKPQNT